MAKPRKKRSETKSLISPAVSAFLNHRFMELIGLIYFILALIVAAILFSYSPLDASLNHAITGYTENWFGSLGATIADGLYQWIGYASFVFVIALVVYGIRYMRSLGLKGATKWRVLWLIPTVFGLCFLLHPLTSKSPELAYGFKSFGGAIGYLTYSKFMNLPLNDWGYLLSTVIVAAITFVTFTLALILPFRFWYLSGRMIVVAIIAAITWIIARVKNRRHRDPAQDLFMENSKRKPVVIMPNRAMPTEEPPIPLTPAQRAELRRQKQQEQQEQQRRAQQAKSTNPKQFFKRASPVLEEEPMMEEPPFDMMEERPIPTPRPPVQTIKKAPQPMKPVYEEPVFEEPVLEEPIITEEKPMDMDTDDTAEGFADMVLKKVRAKKRMLRAEMLQDHDDSDLMEDDMNEEEDIAAFKNELENTSIEEEDIDDEDDEDDEPISLPTQPKGRTAAIASEPEDDEDEIAAHKQEILKPIPKPRLGFKNPLRKAPQHDASPAHAKSNVISSTPKMPAAMGEEYIRPSTRLLSLPPHKVTQDQTKVQVLEEKAEILEQTLLEFGVKGQITSIRPGPVVTLFELEPAPGTRTSRVVGLSDDIARQMLASSVRVAAVPGKNVIGIEMPNNDRETVWLRSLLEHESFTQTSAKLAVTLGEDIGGQPMVVDLAKMPHLLIAGTTGSGKSVAVNTMILSLLYRLSPEDCKLILIDPKMLELSVYENIPHLLTPVVTDPMKAVVSLKWAVREMDDRYRKMAKLGVRNILGYNARIKEALKNGETLSKDVQTGFDDQGRPIMETIEFETEKMPYIVIIIDEVADLMMMGGRQDIEMAVQRLAQKARAAGIHVIMATQRPSVDVITGTIKANFPTRISFAVTSRIDSRTILGEQGAEQLLGMGDMLYMAGGSKLTRAHGPFVSDEEVEIVANHVRAQGIPQYVSAVTEDVDEGAGMGNASMGNSSEQDALYDQALAIILREKKASISFIQRQLSIGYNRAAKIIEQMEAEGVVSAADRVGRREILIEDHTGDAY